LTQNWGWKTPPSEIWWMPGMVKKAVSENAGCIPHNDRYFTENMILMNHWI
jgi:hypothetical protein